MVFQIINVLTPSWQKVLYSVLSKQDYCMDEWFTFRLAEEMTGYVNKCYQCFVNWLIIMGVSDSPEDTVLLGVPVGSLLG